MRTLRVDKRWWQDESAYTVSLTMSFLTITVGAILLLICLWLGSAIEGYEALRSAAASAAFAGQSQGTVSPQFTAIGVSSIGWTLNDARAQTQAQALWQQEVQGEHLTAAFSHLQVQVSEVGADVVVKASGDYRPLFLDRLIAFDPRLISQAAIPMHVQVTEQWDVPGYSGGG